MARRKETGKGVTSSADACPKSPKPLTGETHPTLRTRPPGFNRTHMIALGLVSLTLFSVFSVGQWYMFMVPLQGNTIISSIIVGGDEGDDIRSLTQLGNSEFIAAGMTASWGLGGFPYEPYDFWLVKLDENLNILWNQTYGTNSTEYYTAFTECSDGGFALVGYTVVNKSGSYDADVFLVRTDENGNQLWNQTLGGPEADYPLAMVQCEDDGFALAGETYSYGAGRSDAWLLRIDSDGNPLWNQTYGGPEGDGAWDLVETDSGFLLVGGTASYTNNPETNNPDAYLICTDVDGDLLWNRTYGDWTEDSFNRIIPVSSGGYLLSGGRWSLTWFTYINANGDIIWEKPVGLAGAGGRGLIECHDGGFALVGSFSLSIAWIDYDLYIARTDTQGNTLWTREYGIENLPDGGSDILQLVDGSLLIAGYTHIESIDNGDAWFIRVTDVPIMHYIIAQGFLAGIIISFTVLIITVLIIIYYFIRRRRVRSE